ncbi:MAG: hypothetical protein IPP57_19910 [Candidatus Obscuribacter sp.]|nr:hypothetical protein [Candidatus Obscuribacter sp.]
MKTASMPMMPTTATTIIKSIKVGMLLGACFEVRELYLGLLAWRFRSCAAFAVGGKALLLDAMAALLTLSFLTGEIDDNPHRQKGPAESKQKG